MVRLSVRRRSREVAREAVKTAVSKKIDLIVMGSHRVRPGPPANGRGTTSYKVVT